MTAIVDDGLKGKRVLRVLSAEAGRTLCDVLSGRWGIAPSRVRTIINVGSTWIDGERCRDGERSLRAGQKVVAFVEVGRSSEAPTAGEEGAESVHDLSIDVNYLDSDVAVVMKPSGLPSISPRRGGASLTDRIAERFGDAARLVHRLDRDASGLLVVSLRAESREALAVQVREHRLQRGYLAIVDGKTIPETMILDKPLASRRGGAVVGGAGAKEARTQVFRRGVVGERALVEVILDTGRLHQIRAHLADAGYPLFGDGRYGGPDAPRLALHAHRLGFVHPKRGDRVAFQSPLPEVLERLFALGR
ncbi:MAG: RluA family pseudouridine synthase [Deltaproteobacteria bacterium]|nr:RluA family pseudouridine synthase [Deltaproteobacteria bacterium]